MAQHQTTWLHNMVHSRLPSYHNYELYSQHIHTCTYTDRNCEYTQKNSPTEHWHSNFLSEEYVIYMYILTQLGKWLHQTLIEAHHHTFFTRRNITCCDIRTMELIDCPTLVWPAHWPHVHASSASFGTLWHPQVRRRPPTQHTQRTYLLTFH